MSLEVPQVTVLRKFVDCSVGSGDLNRAGILLSGGDRLEFRQAKLAKNYGAEGQRGESYTFTEKE